MTAETIDHAAPPLAPAPQPVLQPVVAPPPYVPLVLCGCGHEQDAHEHHRAGSDCGVCGAARCKRFRRRTERAAWFLVGRTRTAVVDAARRDADTIRACVSAAE